MQSCKAEPKALRNLHKSKAQTTTGLKYRPRNTVSVWPRLNIMLRISGINIPDEKRIEISLTYIFGIGNKTASKILDELKIDKNKKTRELSEKEQNEIRNYVEKKLKTEGELKHEIRDNIKRLKEISCYRGYRHQRGLPVRGQRTKTNTRTVRGNVRRTMGSGRVKAEKT
jgi:small subunit ribosomal protein S13